MISLKVNDTKIEGIDEMSISSSIYALSALAVIKFTDSTPNDFAMLLQYIREGNTAEISIDDTVLMRGYVKKITPCYDNQQQSLDITIQSQIAKYINRPITKGKYYINQTTDEILKDLCPDIEIDVQKSVQIPVFVSQSEEKTDEVIARLAKIAGVLIYSKATGKLTVEDKTTETAVLDYLTNGVNILKIENRKVSNKGVKIISQLPLDDNIDIDSAISTALKSKGSIGEVYVVDYATPAVLHFFEKAPLTIQLESSKFFSQTGNLLQVNQVIGTENDWTIGEKAMLITAIDFRLINNVYTAVMELEAIIGGENG